MPLQRKMSGARLGIVGMGRIGKAIADRAKAFGMSIAYTARSPKPALPWRYLPSARALAAESDFLVAITPGGAGTRKLIDAEVLAALGPDVVLNLTNDTWFDTGAEPYQHEALARLRAVELGVPLVRDGVYGGCVIMRCLPETIAAPRDCRQWAESLRSLADSIIADSSPQM